MDLRSGHPFWTVKNGLIASYPHLTGQQQADVVIIGAGITGALIGDALTNSGLSVIMLDGRDVAHGSTSASTALLQYEIDTPLWQLQEWCGPVANELYRFGLYAIDKLGDLVKQLNADVDFQKRNSLYFASTPADLPDLCREFEARQKLQFPVEYLSEAEIATRYDFQSPGAIYSLQAAEVDSFRLAHALLRRVTDRGGRVFDRSEVVDYEASDSRVVLRTASGSVTARSAIVAGGYESMRFLPEEVASLHSTYAFVSEPLDDFPGWSDRCLLWETARPYLYMRTTADNRLLAGGEDIAFRNATLRDQLLPGRIEKLADRVRSLFPRIPLTVDYSWAGTFAETADGLPMIGPHPERPGLLFALCYGGNGITYSVLAAELLRDHLQGRRHPLADAVAFDRPSLKLARGS